MSTIPDKLVVISGEYDDWIPLQRIDDEATIVDEVQTISCDTRDFALGWNFKKPEPYKKPECGLEDRTNDGLARALMLACESYCRQKGIFRIDLNSVLTDWVQEFYKNCGYKPIKEEDGFMQMYKILD